MVILKAMAITAPKEAPDETPRVEPSARGFFSSPCIAPPHIDKDAPTSATQITLGSLTDKMIGLDIPSGTGKPQMLFQINRAVSFRGMLTLPTQTHNAKTATVVMPKSKKSRGRKDSCERVKPVSSNKQSRGRKQEASSLCYVLGGLFLRHCHIDKFIQQFRTLCQAGTRTREFIILQI